MIKYVQNYMKIIGVYCVMPFPTQQPIDDEEFDIQKNTSSSYEAAIILLPKT